MPKLTKPQDQISRMMEFLHTTKQELEYLMEGFTEEYEAFKKECHDRDIFDEQKKLRNIINQ